MASGFIPCSSRLFIFIQKAIASAALFAIFRSPFPRREPGIFLTTINRQLFFVWLDNAFAFALRLMTIGS